MSARETLKDLSDASGPHAPEGDPVPGLVLIFSRDRPLSGALRVGARASRIGSDLAPRWPATELSRRTTQ